MSTVTTDGIDTIHRTVRGWNLLRLEWISRALTSADPAGLGASRVGGLRDALDAAGSAADPVLLDPRFGRWCAELVSLIERDAPALLPAGRFRAACRDAAAFTLAARLLLHLRGAAADRAETGTAVRVDHEGRIRLPGTGLALVPGLGLAGRDVMVSLRDGRFVRSGGALPELPTEPEPAVLSGLIVIAGAPVDLAACAAEPLLVTGPPSVVIEPGTSDPAVPGIAQVPPGADPVVRARHALAAAAHLRSTAEGARLFAPGARVPDPPPDIAHLASAPLVTRFLTLHGSAREPAAAPAEVAPAEVAPAEVRRLMNQLARWLAAGSLTPLGEDLRRRLGGDDGRPGPVDSAAGPVDSAAGPVTLARPADSTEPAWRAAWADAGGTFRQPWPGPGRLTADDPDLALLLAELGAGEGIVVNMIADGRPRADPTIDQLSLVKARDRERYAALVGRLAARPRCLAEEVLLGHQAYVEERFSDAAARYADLLLRLPGDIDLWRDFAFALRHLGATEQCETVLFRLADVVERAEECDIDLAVLDRLCPCSSRGPGQPPPAVRQLNGLIDWVGR